MDAKKLKEAYKKNKNKPKGKEIECTVCGKRFIKKTNKQVFCGGRENTKCKDKYWNTVIESKRNNTDRISPAYKQYLKTKSNEHNQENNPEIQPY